MDMRMSNHADVHVAVRDAQSRYAYVVRSAAVRGVLDRGRPSSLLIRFKVLTFCEQISGIFPL